MRRASLLTIFLILFVDLIGFGILLPSQAYIGEKFGIKSYYALVMLGPAFSLCQFLCAPLLGRWSDRAGRRPILLLSQFGSLIGYLLFFGSFFVIPIAPTLAVVLLYLARIIDGISGGNISIAFAYIADVTTPENRAKGMGMGGAAIGAGFIFGPAIGGTIVAYCPHAWALQAIPIAAAVFSLAALVSTYLFLGESHHPGEATPDARRYSASVMEHALLRPNIGPMILMGFFNAFAFAGMEQTFSLILQVRAGLTPEAAAKPANFLFVGIGLVIVLVQGGAIRPLTKALGEAPLVAAGPVFIAAGLLLIGLASVALPFWPAMICGSFFMAIGSSIFTPSLQSLISRHASKREQGEVLGANSGMQSLARGIGPILAGALFQYASPSAPYFVSAGICLLVALVGFSRQKKLRPPVSSDQVQPAATEAPAPSAE